MKNVNLLITFLLLVCPLAMMAQQVPDTTAVNNNDSITWNKELDGVVVKAQRQLIKQDIDRVAYDVQHDEEAKTQTVMDMLRKVPMVTVDGQDNIQVKGNSNFKVYKNGHLDPSLTKNAKEVFKSMPASMVKRIEVITDPGAREDAEGVDAVLNIVTLTNTKMQGVTGVVSSSLNTLGHTSFYSSLTGQLGKLMLSGNYGYNSQTKRNSYNRVEISRTYLDTGNTLLSGGEGSNPGHIHFADIDASYDIDSLNLLSASFGGYFYTLNVQGGGYNKLLNPAGQSLYSYRTSYWMPGYNHHSWNGRFDYQHKTHLDGERLTLSYMLALTRQHTDQENSYTELNNVSFPYTGSLSNMHERFTEHTFQIDWLRPLGCGHQLEVGAKYIDRHNNSHSAQNLYGIDADTSDDFQHTTRVLAGYADYIFRTAKFSARAGLRYEYSYLRGSYPDGKGTTFDKHLGDWVPQATLKYQLTDAQSIKLNYTTSINRPGISYLNPAVNVSPAFISQGNPQLSSSHTQRISFIYTYIMPNLTLQLAPGYNAYSSGISQIVTVKDDIRYSTYNNILTYRRFSVEQYVQWKPFDATTFVFNNNARYEHYENPNPGYRNHGWSDNYSLSLQQRLPLKLRLSLSAYGKLRHSPSSVYSVEHSYFDYYASLQRSFLKGDRLTVRFTANAPFNKYWYMEAETVNGDFTGIERSWNRNRSFSISASWRFGSLKSSVKKTEHSIENSDVVGGISKSN